MELWASEMSSHVLFRRFRWKYMIYGFLGILLSLSLDCLKTGRGLEISILPHFGAAGLISLCDDFVAG